MKGTSEEGTGRGMDGGREEANGGGIERGREGNFKGGVKACCVYAEVAISQCKFSIHVSAPDSVC